MRILDRYVSHVFLLAMGVFLASFLFLAILIDFVSRADNFFELKEIDLLLFIPRFYLIRIPFFLMYLLPPVTLFAAMFAIFRMLGTNEIVPILVSGISMRRAALPFVVVALLAGGAMAAIDEWVMPATSLKVAETEGIVRNENFLHNIEVNDGHGTYFFILEYLFSGREMSDVVVTVVGEGGTIERLFVAHGGKWNKREGKWLLRDGKRYEYGPGRERTVTLFGSEGILLDSFLKPADITNAPNTGGQSLTFMETLRLCDKHPENPYLRMRLHTKLSFPFSPLLLILIGLPFVVRGESKSIFKGLFLCLVATFVYYAFHFFFLDIGGRGMITPFAAVWIPVALFAGFGTVLFFSMRT